MKKLLFVIALGTLLMLAGACASGGPKTEKVDRMTLVEQHLARISADIAEVRQQGRDNAKDVEELRKLIEERSEELGTGVARYSVKIDSLESSLNQIAEKVDDSELRITNLRREFNELRYTRTYGGYTRPEETTTPVEGRPTGEEGGEEAQPDETAPSISEGDAYQSAYADFMREEYNQALTSFREFMRSFPESGRAGDAQFYIGESLYNLGEYEAAVEEYDAVILHYPNSQFRVTATYKKALAFLNSNQTAQGVILLQQLIHRHPDSSEARLARQRLSSLGLNP